MAPFLAARRHVTSRARALATALTALALLLRLALPMAPMPALAAPTDALAELLAGGGICHADPDAAPRQSETAPGKHVLSCLLCPLCTGPAPLLAAVSLPLPLPSAVPVAAIVMLPPATAPPPAPYRHARPRGPPALSA